MPGMATPPCRQVEQRLVALEAGDLPDQYDALLFPTGMTAITNILLSIMPTGSHVIFTDDSYRKTRQFCQTFLKRLGIESSQVPMGITTRWPLPFNPTPALSSLKVPPIPICAWLIWRSGGHCPAAQACQNDD